MSSACASCAGLVGKPHDAEPHPGLKPQSGRKLAYGWHEIYACGQCGTLLQRTAVLPDSAPGAGEPWSSVGEARR